MGARLIARRRGAQNGFFWTDTTYELKHRFNAIAETVIDLFKTEVIDTRRSCRGLKDVLSATLEWVDWFKHRRLREPIGCGLPVESGSMYSQQSGESAIAA